MKCYLLTILSFFSLIDLYTQYNLHDYIQKDGYYFRNVYTGCLDSIIFYSDEDTTINELLHNSIDSLDDAIRWRLSTNSGKLIQSVSCSKDGIFNGMTKVFNVVDSAQFHFEHGYKSGYSSIRSGKILVVNNYLFDQLHGYQYTLRNDRLIELIPYDSGQINGVWISWHWNSDRQVIASQIEYIDGKIADGHYLISDPEGRKYIDMNYLNGFLNGDYNIFNTVGELVEQRIYKNGRIISQKRY